MPMPSEPRKPVATGWRVSLVAAAAVFTLAFVNYEIAGKEQILEQGTPVLLELAPIDPRSLLQGDYMALRYAMADEVARAAAVKGISDGRIVIALDDDDVAQFVRLYEGEPLGERQHLLQFRKRGESVRLASDAWFFEEGTAEAFRGARYGELRVSGQGEAVLVGVRRP